MAKTSTPSDDSLTDSLSTFAASRTVRSGKCWLCSIPECAAVEQAIKNKTANRGLVVEWLITERGYSPTEATKAKVDYHFQSNHHLRGTE